jgi:hypothetical protein
MAHNGSKGKSAKIVEFINRLVLILKSISATEPSRSLLDVSVQRFDLIGSILPLTTS